MIQEFIKSNFHEAVKIQTSFGHDQQMVDAVQNEALTAEMVKDWMRKYGLFQGIKKDVREKIANEFIAFTTNNKTFGENEIPDKFQNLHEILKSIENRKWLSATSKLLWCINPKEVVIYDAFVERSILILQCLDEDLAKFPRMNTPPNARKDFESQNMTKYYMNYQNLVKSLYERNKDVIQDLKSKSTINYEYDLRVLDKLLWIMGNFKEKFVLNKIECLP